MEMNGCRQWLEYLFQAIINILTLFSMRTDFVIGKLD